MRWAVRGRPALSAVLGAVAFVLLVEGYRMVSGWRPGHRRHPEVRTRRSAPAWVPVISAGAVVSASILLVVAYTALPRLLT